MNLNELLENTLSAMGFDLVDLEMSPKGRTIRVFMDTPAESDVNVTVDDCERVSNQLSHLFMVEGMDYDRLEVSSPGLDRPLKKLADFARFAGQEAQLTLRAPIGDSRKMKVLLRGVDENRVLAERGDEPLTIEFSQIERARLVPKIEWRKAK
jgi:ribosome maturation factor RimP